MSGSHIYQFARRAHTVFRHISPETHPGQSQLHQVCLSTSSVSEKPGPVITAEPRVALYDDIVRITLQNFPAQEPITLHGQVTQLSSKINFASCGHFITDAVGAVDVSNDASQGGTFTGVEPMGILWSLRVAPGHPSHMRMAINFTDRPCTIHMRAYLGHLDLEDIYTDQGEVRPSTNASVVAETKLERSYRAPGVTRVEVEDGSIRGALYLPSGEGPFQGVIDMFGSSGGLIEYRSALLASRGFAALSLAYFKYKDLQDSLYDLRYEYFEEAIKWLTNHPKVVSSGIGVVAVSKGTENALLMGAYSPNVTAVVAINGYCHAFIGDFLRNGKVLLKAPKIEIDKMVSTDEGFDLRSLIPESADLIPVWQGKAKYLFFQCLDDYQTGPDTTSSLLAACPEEKRRDIQVVQYEGAGHLLEPPYNPLCRTSLNKGVGVVMKWGGKPREHAYAQVDAWQRTLDFLRSNIPAS